MGKSSFLLKSLQLSQKMTKNDQKLITNSGVKMRSNLTIKTGDSGSAGMLEENSVITEAPNLDTKTVKN